jgi:hypothetical protein
MEHAWAGLIAWFLLLRTGGAGSTADQVGVLLTIGQWLLFDRAIRPRAADQVTA